MLHKGVKKHFKQRSGKNFEGDNIKTRVKSYTGAATGGGVVECKGAGSSIVAGVSRWICAKTMDKFFVGRREG